MMELRYTLMSDGSSDRALIPLINWVLRNAGVDIAIQSNWADLYRLPRKPTGLAERIVASVKLYPCSVLFIHRDAEGESLLIRRNEIDNGVKTARDLGINVPEYVCVVPVRMQEAWLLFDEKAIRQAAGNPNGTVRLKLPSVRRVEKLPDPKGILHSLLEEASELTGRRRRRLDISKSAYRVAELTDSFESLRNIPAFTTFEKDVKELVHRLT